MNIFGNSNALVGSIDLLFAAIFVLGAFITRKAVNDNLQRGFSVIGASAGGVVGWLIVDNIFNTMKFSFAGGLVLWLVGGFLLADIIQDGEA